MGLQDDSKAFHLGYTILPCLQYGSSYSPQGRPPDLEVRTLRPGAERLECSSRAGFRWRTKRGNSYPLGRLSTAVD
ncbi:hypothetical protein AAC387_Pa02g1267 [Persea americana]